MESTAAGSYTQGLPIRMGCGAVSGKGLSVMFGEGLRVARAGVAVGLAIAWRLTCFIASLLYGVRFSRPIAFVLAALPLPLIALDTYHFPAWAPTRVDPWWQ